MNHILITKGQFYGHIFRRCIHVFGVLMMPILYYFYGSSISQWVHLSINKIFSLVAFFAIALEFLRLKLKIIVPGHREYERYRISSFAFGIVTIVLVVLTLPKYGLYGAAFGFPIIACMALTDPIMGELRRLKFKTPIVIVAGVISNTLVFLAAIYFLHIPILISIILIPISVYAEWINVPAVDDNAMMLLLPSAILILSYPWL